MKFILLISGIHMINIANLDLNLLISLMFLLETRSVSAAAKKLGITQPAMSNTLARLRASFGDELLVRASGSMVPTAKAIRMQPSLKRILNDIQLELLQEQEFDPTLHATKFTFGFHDYEKLVLLPQLTKQLCASFPQTRIEFRAPKSHHPTDDLSTGVLDFTSGPALEDADGIYGIKLFSDDFVCLTAKRTSSGPLTLKQYAALDHLFIAPHGGMSGKVDDALNKVGLQRNVRFAISEFSIVPWLLENSDLIVTLPRRVADLFAKTFPVSVSPCPVKLDSFSIYLSWHVRNHKSAPHQWMKDLLAQTACS
jgi:DNA-binding transcriptional LysR family regulator